MPILTFKEISVLSCIYSAQYGPSTPVRIQLLNRHMSLLKGADSITTLLKSSRDLSSEHWLVQALVNAFGVEVADAPFYLADDTGIGNQPDPRSKMTNPDHRIFHLVFKSVHSGLSGASLEEMERQLVRNLSSQIHQTDIKSDTWTDISDLYGSLIRTVAFRASVVSLCGAHVFETIPTFVDDFWVFDSALPDLFKEMPRWLAPASYAARDRMKQNLQKWQAFAHEHYDVRQGQLDNREWEEFFGSRLMRTRHEFFQKMPLSKETIAADDLGLIWAYEIFPCQSDSRNPWLIPKQGDREHCSCDRLDATGGSPASGALTASPRRDCSRYIPGPVRPKPDGRRHSKSLQPAPSPIHLRRGFAHPFWHRHQPSTDDFQIPHRRVAFQEG